ncbi:hypothetical protein ACVUCS_004444 [Salmonella enterica subsp. enterica]|nr:hypothetical protein [Salmonella enterica subsp. enterica serovar Volkmarsdorf]EDW1644229.1 hypothetical protein [Salmonella enterica subsp. enterica serovar Baguida]
MKSILIFILCLIFCGAVNATSSKLSLESIKEASLKECLDMNYSKLDLYNAVGLNDKSYLFIWFDIDNKSTKKSKELKKYIQSRVGDFYLSKLPVKDSDSNMVLILCMKFYNSTELKEYILNEILK